MLEPREGLLTFRSEGNDVSNSLYYSRKIHWPGNIPGCSSNSSGVTIGRGFDLGNRSKDETLQALSMAGIPKEQAKKIANGAGLTHCQANNFVIRNKNEIGEITESQQLQLFNTIYPSYASDAVRFYNKYKKSNSVNWDKLHPALKEVFIDMKYQGILTQKMVYVFSENDSKKIISLLQKTPDDERRRSRVDFLMGNIK